MLQPRVYLLILLKLEMTKESIKIFSPATVANVSCGYDVLGFCLDTIGDEMIVRKTAEKGITISKIHNYDLPFEAEKNVAGVAALAMLNDLNIDHGFDIEIFKNIKPGSGIGSSAASAAGTVVAINELLSKPFNNTQLTAFAMKGEALASGSEHADNIAPAIFGGFTLVKSIEPLKVLEIPTPDEFYATVIHPEIEIKTAESRAILPKEVPLYKAVTQWANVGSLIHGLHTNDYELIADSLHDVLVEPYRGKLIPNYDELKAEVMNAGALGCSISGSGPSVFALSKGENKAKEVEKAMEKVYSKTGIPFNIYVSKINKQGVKIL